MIMAVLRPVLAGDGVAVVWVEVELGAEDLEEVLVEDGREEEGSEEALEVSAAAGRAAEVLAGNGKVIQLWQ